MSIGRGSLARLTLLALLWGSSFLWIAIALRGFSPVQIVLIRLALGALVLLAIVHSRGLRLPANGLIWLHLTVAALFANAIPYTLFAIGEQHVSSSVAVILGAAILGDHITTQIIGGMLIVLTGVAITRRDHPAGEPRNDLPMHCRIWP